LGIFKLLLGERFGALEEGRELDFQEPSELGFEDAELSGAREGKFGMRHGVDFLTWHGLS
jgi:hypothetical protein